MNFDASEFTNGGIFFEKRGSTDPNKRHDTRRKEDGGGWPNQAHIEARRILKTFGLQPDER